jgi:hypothetical protein
MLLRACAIEIGNFVFTLAQCRICKSSRKAYERSLIISTMGEILAEGCESNNELKYTNAGTELIKKVRLILS